MRYIVLAFGVCGLLCAGLTIRAGGQPNEKDDLAPHRQAGLSGGDLVRGQRIKLVGENSPAAARVGVIGGDGN